MPALAEYLRDAKQMIDLLVDQSEEGLEILPGTTTYTYDGNWKLQAENGVDGYHLEAIHGNYVMTIANRAKLKGNADKVKSVAVGELANGTTEMPAGYFSYGNGHVTLFGSCPTRKIDPFT